MRACRTVLVAAVLMLFGSWLAPAEEAPLAERICVYSADSGGEPADDPDLAPSCGGRLRGYWSLNWCEPGAQSC